MKGKKVRPAAHFNLLLAGTGESSQFKALEGFVATIKTAVARRYNSMSSGSRNCGNTLNAEQCAAIDRLFN